MKNGRYQAKDIDDRFFLECVDFLSMQPKYPWERDLSAVLGFNMGPKRLPLWVNRGDLDYVMPMFPPAVILSKASRLMGRGLMGGCDCGCRGDFELTELGREFLRNGKTEAPSPRALRRSLRRQAASIQQDAFDNILFEIGRKVSGYQLEGRPLPEWLDVERLPPGAASARWNTKTQNLELVMSAAVQLKTATLRFGFHFGKAGE